MASNALFAEVAALSGDPARATMLHALMDGRALTATELARAAGITPQAVAVLRQVRQNRQVRRRVSSAQVWLIGYALLHRAPLDFPSRRRGFSPHSATSRRRAPR